MCQLRMSTRDSMTSMADTRRVIRRIAPCSAILHLTGRFTYLKSRLPSYYSHSDYPSSAGGVEQSIDLD